MFVANEAKNVNKDSPIFCFLLHSVMQILENIHTTIRFCGVALKRCDMYPTTSIEIALVSRISLPFECLPRSLHNKISDGNTVVDVVMYICLNKR